MCPVCLLTLIPATDDLHRQKQEKQLSDHRFGTTQASDPMGLPGRCWYLSSRRHMHFANSCGKGDVRACIAGDGLKRHCD